MERLIENNAEITKGSIGFALGPHKEGLSARDNVLAHVGLWPTFIKLNLSGKTEVSKSAWIKPCLPISLKLLRTQKYERTSDRKSDLL